MLIHKILTYHGETMVPIEGGQQMKAHSYKAKCGTAIYSQHIFTQLQEVAIGKLPHVQCAACFKGPSGKKGDETRTPMFTGELDQPVHDETGQLARTEVKEEGLGTPFDNPFSQSQLRVKKTVVEREDKIGEPEEDDGLGKLESNDWGKPT